MTDSNPQRIEARAKLSTVGFSRRYAFSDVSAIPAQWTTFAARIPQITAETNPTTYGIIYNGTQQEFDYLTAVELPNGATAPSDMSILQLQPQTYAIYLHTDHVATLGSTCDAIWSQKLPASGHTPVWAPWFERYGDNFDPSTGNGGLEIWIPIDP